MGVVELFEKIAGRQIERRQQKVTNYRDLVAGIATGEEPDAETVELTLADAGNSLDDLKHAVEQYQRRMTLKAAVAMLPKVEEQRKQVEQQIAAADRQLEAAEARHEEITGPLFGMMDQLNAARNDASAAERELFLTCDVGALRDELDDLHQQATALMTENSKLLSQAVFYENKAAAEIEDSKRQTSEFEQRRCEGAAATYRQTALSTRASIKANEKAQAELAQQQAAVEQQMRDS